MELFYLQLTILVLVFLLTIAARGGPGTKPEPETGTVGTVFPGTERGTRTAGTVLQEPKPQPEPSSLLNCTETHKNPLKLEEPPEPKSGTARPVPSPNRNRTEPNRGHPVTIAAFWLQL